VQDSSESVGGDLFET